MLDDILDEELSENTVEGLQQGLKIAKITRIKNLDKIDNARYFGKIDSMMNLVSSKVAKNEDFKVERFHRGWYDLLFLYDKKKHILYSFMSEKRLSSLIRSTKLKEKSNYIFALMKFNYGDRQQQTFFSNDVTMLSEQEKIQEKVRRIIENDSEIQYVTIAYEEKDYKLLNVRAIKMSQYAETIDEKDMSAYIKADYEDIYDDIKVNNDKDEILGDLDINFKSDVLAESEDLTIELTNEKMGEGKENE